VAKKITPENIGTAIGQLANKIDAWKKQRDVLIAEGERVAGVALDYVRDLRGHSAPVPKKGAATRKGGRPKGMKMSEETKAKLRDAWKRRKSGSNTGGNAEHSKPADGRAVVRATSGRKWQNRQSKRG
jgi:hypothetical protein